MTKEEILLYFFLVLTCDRFGISFYSDEKTAALLKLTLEEISLARDRLIEKGLIVFSSGISQVLPIPQGTNWMR